MKLTKKEKQKHLFKAICFEADKNNEVKSAAGVLYKAITICPSLEVIEDIRKWSKEEWNLKT